MLVVHLGWEWVGSASNPLQLPLRGGEYFLSMRISYSQLKKLSVETKSGKSLGHVVDVVVDIDSQSIVQYEVTPSMLSTKTYLVGQAQIVSITSEKMIVDDTILDQEQDERALSVADVMNRDQVAVREEVS